MENNFELGKSLIEYGLSHLDRSNFAVISYEGGITEFDDSLSGIKFCNTDCISTITVFEKAVLFALSLNNLNPICFKIIKREEILDFQVERNIPVEVPAFNRFKAAFGGAMWTGGGAVGGLIGTFIEIQKSKKLKFKVKESKIENGQKFTIRHRTPDDQTHEIIYVASNEANRALWLEELLNIHWTSEYAPSNPVVNKGCMVIVSMFLILSTILLNSILK